MSEFDPSAGISYGAWLRRKRLQVKADRFRSRVREGRDEAGRRTRVVTERTESGALATTTNRSSERGEHQDVHIHAPAIVATGSGGGEVIAP